jgi:hypothetical protein
MALLFASGAHVPKVHSAPVLEKHHFRLVITRISITLRTFLPPLF